MKFTREMHELYELAQDKFSESAGVCKLCEGFAAGVQHTLDWLRGEAPYPFDTDNTELEESPGKRELQASTSELFNSADTAGVNWELREDNE